MLQNTFLLRSVRSLAFVLCFSLFATGLSAYGYAASSDSGGKRSIKQTTSQNSRLQSRKARASSKRRYKRKATGHSYDYKGCVIYNAKTQRTIFAKNGDRKIPPASLTKILAMYVAEDAIRNRKINRNTKVTVSAKAAAAGGSRMGLRTGDKVALDELLRGMAVASGNDASLAVAEYIGGSEYNFVKMMNKKARSIGMKRSTFKNANGLPAPGQYTTAKDMLTLARNYLNAYPGNLDKYHSKSVHVYKSKYSCNANPLLGVFEGADGLKTGFVNASGYNLIATAKRGNQRYIGVILGAPSSAIRAQQARTLMEACFTRPSSFAGNTPDVNTKVVAKKASSSKTDAALAEKSDSKKKVSGQKAKKQQVAKTGSATKNTTARSGSGKNKNKPVAITPAKGKKGSAAKSTADKTPKRKKRQSQSSYDKTQQPKQNDLVLFSYS